MALIFNSVTQFEIQPERTKKRVKRDDLDTLSEVWTGPSALEDTFVPAIGTVHPDFSLMTVISTSIKRLPMYVSEITLQYHGKLDNSGASQYTSVPTISQYWAEGEVAMGSGGTTVSRRYSGRCAQIDYLTNRRPSGNPTNIGIADGFLGFTNVWDQVTSFGPSPVTIAPPIQKLSCTDVKVEDKADGWYRVTETYQSRMYPGESITGGPPKPVEKQGPMTIYGPMPLFGGADWYGSLNTVQQDKTQRMTGAQQAVAAGAGGTVQTTTVPTSNAANTAQQTGIDPGSHYVADPGSVASEFSVALDTPPALAASDAEYSWGDLATAAIASYPLEF
jgi:hypothetical protein